MNILRNIVFLIVSVSFLFADSNTSSYIDETHKAISHKTIEWSNQLDVMISERMDNNESNITTDVVQKEVPKPPKKRVKTVDSFFQNKKFLDEAEETFISLRLDSEFQSREPEKFQVKLGGQAALSQSKKRFKLFIDNVTSDNVDDILEDDVRSYPELGVHYFAPDQYGIESKYSVGIRGIDPFVRARYYIIFQTGLWHIEPSQTLKYSLGDKFEEETNIYFDRPFEDLSLFRFFMHRKTEQEKEGMEYSFSFDYYMSPFENIGLRVSQAFRGSTKYQYVINPNIEPPLTDSYGGIYDYESSFSLRHNIWRKWFFYEVRPAVSFHKEHNFKPNYKLRVFLDFYFGNFY